MAIKCILQNQFNQKSLEELEGILPVGSGGTGKNELTAGSFLVGDGTNAVMLKTPEEVLEDIGAATASLSQVTLAASDWTLSGSLYTQTVTAQGVTADADIVVVDVVLTDSDESTNDALLLAWANATKFKLVQGQGTLTFYATSAPTIDIPVSVGVIG